MDWIETLVNGALLGGLYALIGLGLALVFGVMRVVNLAHGEFVVLSAYAAVLLSHLFPSMPAAWLLPLVCALAFTAGYLLQALLVNRTMASADPLRPLLLTFGIAVVLRNLLAEVFGVDPRALDAGAMSGSSLNVLGIHVGLFPLTVLAIAAALFAGLNWVMRRTNYGLVLRATTDNPTMVRSMGVRPARVHAVVMGVAFAMAGVAGVLLAMRTSFTPFSGVERLLSAFEVVIIGGLGSFRGAFVGGLVLGMAQLVGQRIDSNSGSLYAHAIFLVVLMFRPMGLAGGKR